MLLQQFFSICPPRCLCFSFFPSSKSEKLSIFVHQISGSMTTQCCNQSSTAKSLPVESDHVHITMFQWFPPLNAHIYACAHTCVCTCHTNFIFGNTSSMPTAIFLCLYLKKAFLNTFICLQVISPYASFHSLTGASICLQFLIPQ